MHAISFVNAAKTAKPSEQISSNLASAPHEPSRELVVRLKDRPARRYLSLHLCRLPTDRIARLRWGPRWRVDAPQEGPALIVVAGMRDNAMRLIALNEAASRAGLHSGQALTDARAVFPGIGVEAEDADADRLLLEAIADWCDRYTPLVALGSAGAAGDLQGSGQNHGQDHGLMLDIAGSAHLFGGEEALLGEILARLFNLGFAARGAIAATPGAAWAMARFAGESNGPASHAGVIVAETATVRALAELPVGALRLASETVSGLSRLGLYRIGQLMTRPRGPLARRFGRQLLMRLDQAVGDVDEPVSPRLPAPVVSAERRLAEPVSRIADVEQLVLRLAGHLAEALERRGQGARLIDLALWRVDGHVARLGVGASRPVRDPAAMTRLFAERLAALGDELDAGFGFDMVRLSVAQADRFDPRQPAFLEGREADPALAAHLIDRLGARLGIANVLTGHLANTHLPEKAERLEPAFLDGPALPAPFETPAAFAPVRPLRLFARPEPVEAMAEVPDGPPLRFRWRKLLREVTRAEGPERIADEWWARQDERAARDYFRVEDRQGQRYWLFREGLFGGNPLEGGASPRWFIHGLFA